MSNTCDDNRSRVLPDLKKCLMCLKNTVWELPPYGTSASCNHPIVWELTHRSQPLLCNARDTETDSTEDARSFEHCSSAMSNLTLLQPGNLQLAVSERTCTVDPEHRLLGWRVSFTRWSFCRNDGTTAGARGRLVSRKLLHSSFSPVDGRCGEAQPGSVDVHRCAPGVLAKAWRSSKAADFASRAQRLGTGTHPEVLRLLQCIAHESAAVDAIWDEQLAAPESAPWWADGEYNKEEADR